MKEHMSSPTIRSKQETMTRKTLFSNGPKRTKGKYTRLENEMENENQRFIEDQGQQQQLIMEAQDDQMDRVADSVTVLKHMGKTIGNEFDEQAV
ncbi:putative syntaxin-6-like [Apostichopus japonicus]|uniref:Putative syntaxin-6-like n=2 Tax=Stichopus japonicus TaxID=307972 RepID=A0A2G8KKE9_STIJA|nr:putative syntaxin-6-like [Apostichopus japonicus]